MNEDLSNSDIQALVQSYFDRNGGSDGGNGTFTVTTSRPSEGVEADVSGRIDTAFLELFGTNHISVGVESGATFHVSEPTEIVVALDITGSVGFGSSWDDATEAMADLLAELDAAHRTTKTFTRHFSSSQTV